MTAAAAILCAVAVACLAAAVVLLATLRERVGTLREQFANLAARQMKEQGEDLATLNRSQLETALRPLREQFAALQELAHKAQAGGESLGRSISRDVAAIGKIANDLSGVAAALSSDIRVQGRKGEDVLAEKLRQAGLEENVNFFLQTGTGTDRPDAQVCDPENRWLIIDSKVNLTSFVESETAEDEAVRRAKLAAHVASVRQNIDRLAAKKYPQTFAAEHPDRDYLPVTAMFVPYEAPLAAALKEEPSLWQRAAQNNVVLVTPLTLMAYLRLVFLAWQHEKECRNQAEIVDTARELLSRMNTFLLAFEEVGASIDSLHAAYEKAKGTIVDAPRAHTIAKSAQKLIGLHVRLENRKGRRPETASCLHPDSCFTV